MGNKSATRFRSTRALAGRLPGRSPVVSNRPSIPSPLNSPSKRYRTPRKPGPDSNVTPPIDVSVISQRRTVRGGAKKLPHCDCTSRKTSHARPSSDVPKYTPEMSRAWACASFSLPAGSPSFEAASAGELRSGAGRHPIPTITNAQPHDRAALLTKPRHLLILISAGTALLGRGLTRTRRVFPGRKTLRA